MEPAVTFAVWSVKSSKAGPMFPLPGLSLSIPPKVTLQMGFIVVVTSYVAQ